MGMIICFSCRASLSGQEGVCNECQSDLVIVSTFYENDQLKSRGRCRDGKREGLWVEYYEDGDLEARTHYKNGIREGLIEWCDDHGLAFRGNYKTGIREGVWEYFRWGKVLVSRETWKNGYPVSGKRFYENGQLKSRCSFKKDEAYQLHGLYEEFDENGLLKERREYDEDGLFDWKQIFKNGVLQEEPIIRI